MTPFRASAALLALAACAAPGPTGTDEPPSDAPLGPIAATTSSAGFVRLFAENCLALFPDTGAAARAFAADGFAVESDQDGYQSLSADAGRLEAMAGTVAILYATEGDDLPSSSTMCRLSGSVSDPQAFEAALRALTDPSGRPLAWSDDGPIRFASLRPDGERNSTGPYVEVRLPVLEHAGPTDAGASLVCGSLPECRFWSEASLEVARRNLPE